MLLVCSSISVAANAVLFVLQTIIADHASIDEEVGFVILHPCRLARTTYLDTWPRVLATSSPRCSLSIH